MSGEQYNYPQKMGRVILLGMEEVMGVNVVNGVLRLNSLEQLMEQLPPAKDERTFSFETVSGIQIALELAYGPRGGRGLALRAGRAAFKYGLKEYGSMLGMTETAFRILPLPRKLQTGAKTFADLFNKQTDQIVRVEETEDKILWHIERCPLCWGRKEEEPVCHLAVGLLQEALYWVSGGKVFNVTEISCIAEGDKTCTISIETAALS